MITELEERVMKLLKAAITIAITYDEFRPSEEEMVTKILNVSEVALHQEAIDELVVWLKELIKSLNK